MYCCSTFLLYPSDLTCFVPEDRVYECGVNVSSESECEASGCCYNSSADIQCYYPSGYSPKPVTVDSLYFCFIDADECALGLDNCHSNAYCTDYEYGFSCTCLTGYSGNGTYCESEDISCTLS